MADNYQAPALAVVALLLFAAATPLARGQIYDTINIGGKLCCTYAGNCPSGAAGLAGVPLALNCTNLLSSDVTLATGVTGPTGAFNIITSNFLANTGGAVSGMLPCAVVVKLPPNQTVCQILSTVSGLLVGVPRLPYNWDPPMIGFNWNLTVPYFVMSDA